MLTLPSKHLVSIAIVESFFSQIIRQKSPAVFGKGPITMIIHFAYVHINCLIIPTLSCYIGIWLVVALKGEYTQLIKSMILS